MLTSEAELHEQIGSSHTRTVIERLHSFVFVPPTVLQSLADSVLGETWGRDLWVLKKYLAVHLFWAIEEGRYTMNDTQLYLSAGWLQTRYGTPVYIVLEKNMRGPAQWFLRHAGPNISAEQLPVPPTIPSADSINPGVEIVMSHDHILGDNADRVGFLRQTPPVAQMCAVAGAIQWSLNRGLQFPQWYYGKMDYIVPLYLQSRENIAEMPDLVAPIQVNPSSLIVRTVLEPFMCYGNARVAVRRHDQLPPWLLHTWNEHSHAMREDDTQDAEARPSEVTPI